MRARVVLCLVLVLATASPAVAKPGLPDPGKVKQLRERARRASTDLDAARRRLDAAVGAYERGRSELERVKQRLRAAEGHLRGVEADLQTARDQLGRRASAIYRHGRLYLLDAVLHAPSLHSFVRTVSLAGQVVREDRAAVRRVEEARAAADHARVEVLGHEAGVHTQVAALAAEQDAVMREMRAVATVLERVRGELGAELGKFRFPVKPPYSYVDTFGAPRMEGTRYAHAHEGTDIFALRGTPVVAVVTGTVFDVGQAPLGGDKLWVRGPDGHTYYYAHLDGFAAAAGSGRRVEAGTVLGYVGDSGNAKGTPPHAHFEVHAPGGRALNPYPILKEAERVWASI